MLALIGIEKRQGAHVSCSDVLAFPDNHLKCLIWKENTRLKSRTKWDLKEQVCVWGHIYPYGACVPTGIYLN